MCASCHDDDDKNASPSVVREEGGGGRREVRGGGGVVLLDTPSGSWAIGHHSSCGNESCRLPGRYDTILLQQHAQNQPPPLSNSVAPCLLESRMVPATDVFPDTTQADQRHTQTVIGDYFSDIDDDEQGDEATSRFLDEDLDLDDEAQPLIGGA